MKIFANFSDNKINCTCANEWIFAASAKFYRHNVSIVDALQLPQYVSLAATSPTPRTHKKRCAPTRESGDDTCAANEKTQLSVFNMRTLNESATTKPVTGAGSNIVLICRFSVPLPAKTSTNTIFDSFAWLMDSEQTRQRRQERWRVSIINATAIRLNTTMLTSDDLGIVVSASIISLINVARCSF